MRWLEVACVAVAAMVLSSGCSRLTFVKPSAQRRGFEQVAPDYTFRATGESRRREQVRLHVGRAVQLLREGRVDDAAGEVRSALRMDPSSADALTVMAQVELARGNQAGAGDYFSRAASAAPDEGAVLNNYGAWLCGQGRAAEAMPWFDRAIAAPGYRERTDALANAGACAEAAGDPTRVERDLRAALELDPENAVALSAMAGYRYRNGRHLEARAFSERRLAAAAATADALVLASQIEEELGDMAAAARYRERLGREFPDALSLQPGGSTQP